MQFQVAGSIVSSKFMNLGVTFRISLGLLDVDIVAVLGEPIEKLE